MIMRRRSLGFSFATVVFLGACAAALAVVSGGLAGSTTNSTFELFVQPQYLTAGGQGFALGKFTAASGSGTGSATHVAMRFDLPAALLGPHTTSSGCTGPELVNSGTTKRFTCTIGTVNAGETVKRYVTFTAPSTPGSYPIDATAFYDKGSGGAGGGGAVNSIPDSAQTTVVEGTSSTRAGNCFTDGTGEVFTPTVSGSDPQATEVEFGAAASFLGLPCTWGFVGEDSVTGFLTQISFVSLPELGAPATVFVEWYSLPVPWPKFTVLLLPNYPASTDWEPLTACENGQLPEDEIACLLSLDKTGRGARATILMLGTGGDPGFGGG